MFGRAGTPFREFLCFFFELHQLSCFYFLVIIHNAAMNIFVWAPVFGYIPRSRVSESYGNSLVNLLRKLQNLQSTSPFYIPTSNTLVFQFLYILTSTCYFHFVFLIIVATLMGVEWDLIVVLITCFSSMANIVEHLFMCFWAICVSSLEKCLFKSFAHV